MSASFEGSRFILQRCCTSHCLSFTQSLTQSLTPKLLGLPSPCLYPLCNAKHEAENQQHFSPYGCMLPGKTMVLLADAVILALPVPGPERVLTHPPTPQLSLA